MRRRGMSLLMLVALALAGAAAADTFTVGPYSYDGAGNVWAVGNERFYYDAFGRLVYGTAGTFYQHYAYDGFGNLLTVATDRQTSPQQEFGVDAATNRLTNTAKSVHGTYDAAGQLRSFSALPGSSFTYDSVGMVRESTLDGVKKVHIYTASDERLASITVGADDTPAQRTWTLRDASGRVLRVVDSDGSAMTWKEDYIHRGTQLLASELPNGVVQHFHPDHLGTPRLITDQGGREISRHTYYPFGLETPETRATNPERMKFTGHERDHGTTEASDLDYMHARYYAPVWGRFLSVDPELDPEKIKYEPQQWNRYSYVTNNPLKYTDPDGKDKFMAWLLGSAFKDVSTWDALKGALTGQHAGPSMSQAAGDWAEDHRQMTGGFSPVPTSKTEVAMMPVLMMLGPAGKTAFNGIITSAIKNDTLLVKAAQVAGRSSQGSLDNLVGQLAKGNLNPGIGTKNLFGNVMYARARDGARVFFRQGRDGSIEILAKANKANEKQVIERLTELYR